MTNPPDSRLNRLFPRRNKNIAAVALANKNARIAWAMLRTIARFSSDYTIVRPAA
jgi:hypothetical protein